eukprot:GAFH01001860.1.p1 GENE.GAFH01001860.1~~GAFH01001860.1.p1  ORF type:complete len:452 (+),score=90.62 GAFH01001860.1:185-1357(+)
MTNIPIDDTIPRNRLQKLVETAETLERSTDTARLAEEIYANSGVVRSLEYPLVKREGAIPLPAPTYATSFVTTHKKACRCAAFSEDGAWIATGSDDATVKLLYTAKLRPHISQKGEPVQDEETQRPNFRTFHDHTGPINEVTFHPREQLVASASQDSKVLFFDYSKSSNRRSTHAIEESYPVRSISYHPTGDYLLVGTEHPVVRLYDMHTMEALCCPEVADHHTAPISQVRFSPQGNLYATSSEDGWLKIWDTVSNRCVSSYKAHDGAEVCSIRFSRRGHYLLTAGRDSIVRLWDLRHAQHLMSVNTYTGAKIQQSAATAVFSHTEDYIFTTDEQSLSIASWDTRLGTRNPFTPSGHNQPIRAIAFSPVEPIFVTCSNDWRARFWVFERV